MTLKEIVPPPSFFRERLWIWLTGIAFTALGATVATVVLSLWTGFGGWLVAMARMPAAVAQLQSDVASLSGANRVIRQIPGMSYIEEPVHQGDQVTMIMVAERTVLGTACSLTDWTPIFTDASNVPVPGERARVGVPSQISDGPSIRRIEMIPPPELLPGRVAVYLTLIYDCGGRTVPDRTDVVAYRLLAAPNP